MTYFHVFFAGIGASPGAIKAPTQMHYLGYVSQWRSQALTRLKRNEVELGELEANQKAKQRELEENVASQRKLRTALQADKRSRQQLLTKVRADIARNKTEIGRLKRDEDRLTKLIDQLSKAIATHRNERKRESVSEKILMRWRTVRWRGGYSSRSEAG